MIRRLKKYASKYVDTDLIDWDALVDSKLTYDENKEILKEVIKGLANSENAVETAMTEYESREKSIKHEKEMQNRVKLENLKREEEYTKQQFNEAIEKIKNSNDALNEIFHIPRKYVELLVKSKDIKSLLFTGKAGLGKSYSTIQKLNELKANYVYHSGFTTPLSLYEFLYEYNDENLIICFDDTYGLMNTQAGYSILLNALYSTTGKRKLMWQSSILRNKDIPKEFIFKSKLILIINELPNNLLSKLIKSRCLTYEFRFNNYEILAIMRAIAQTKHERLSKEERNMIVDFIEQNVDETTEGLDLRLQNKIENIYLADKENWKELSIPLFNSKNEKLVLLKNLINQVSNMRELKEKWINKTGLSYRQLRRYLIKLKENSKSDILTSILKCE